MAANQRVPEPNDHIYRREQRENNPNPKGKPLHPLSLLSTYSQAHGLIGKGKNSTPPNRWNSKANTKCKPAGRNRKI
jgi:hypothetical protein